MIRNPQNKFYKKRIEKSMNFEQIVINNKKESLPSNLFIFYIVSLVSQIIIFYKTNTNTNNGTKTEFSRNLITI